MKRIIISMLLITIFVPALVFTQEVQPVPRTAAPQLTAAQQTRAARARNIDMRARELEEQARNLEMRAREMDEHARDLEMREREMDERAGNLEMRENELREHAENLEMREREMKSPERKMELEQQKQEMAFQGEMKKLELQERRIKLEKNQKADNDELQPILLLILVVNILCAVWVYQDIQKRSHESGLWIVIALITGLLGTLVYAIVRLGDNAKNKA